MTTIEIQESHAEYRRDCGPPESTLRIEGSEAIALYCSQIAQNLNLLRSAVMEMDAVLIDLNPSA